jgi:hypothetical protein
VGSGLYYGVVLLIACCLIVFSLASVTEKQWGPYILCCTVYRSSIGAVPSVTTICTSYGTVHIPVQRFNIAELRKQSLK